MHEHVTTRAERRARRRTTRRVLTDRRRTNRAAARIHRRGTGSLATHAVAAGLPISQARSAAGTMRRCAARLGITGTAGVSFAGRAPARPCTRYTPAQAGLIAADYGKRARKAAYRDMAARLRLAA